MYQTGKKPGKSDSTVFDKTHNLAAGKCRSNVAAELRDGNNLELVESVAKVCMYCLLLGNSEPRLLMDKALP